MYIYLPIKVSFGSLGWGAKVFLKGEDLRNLPVARAKWAGYWFCTDNTSIFICRQFIEYKNEAKVFCLFEVFNKINLFVFFFFKKYHNFLFKTSSSSNSPTDGGQNSLWDLCFLPSFLSCSRNDVTPSCFVSTSVKNIRHFFFKELVSSFFN